MLNMLPSYEEVMQRHQALVTEIQNENQIRRALRENRAQAGTPPTMARLQAERCCTATP